MLLVFVKFDIFLKKVTQEGESKRERKQEAENWTSVFIELDVGCPQHSLEHLQEVWLFNSLRALVAGTRHSCEHRVMEGSKIKVI